VETADEQSGLSRRRLLLAAVLAVGFWQLDTLESRRAFAESAAGSAASLDSVTTSTLEAFADTIVPGEKRSAGDVAIAGAAAGPSAVVAGALDVMAMPEVGIAPVLPGIAQLLNGRAVAYATAHGLVLDPTLPPFVALSFPDRTALALELVPPSPTADPTWILLATLVSWAFDTAAAEHTVDAIADGHPGLAWERFPAPNPDGNWRFPAFSYQKKLANPHPQTTPSGSPA
jgi:enediyne biosynthesis protein E8